MEKTVADLTSAELLERISAIEAEARRREDEKPYTGWSYESMQLQFMIFELSARVKTQEQLIAELRGTQA